MLEIKTRFFSNCPNFQIGEGINFSYSLVITQPLIFSTTDQGNKRIGAKTALMKTKATPNEPHNYRYITHQSDHSPDPLY